MPPDEIHTLGWYELELYPVTFACTCLVISWRLFHWVMHAFGKAIFFVNPIGKHHKLSTTSSQIFSLTKKQQVKYGFMLAKWLAQHKLKGSLLTTAITFSYFCMAKGWSNYNFSLCSDQPATFPLLLWTVYCPNLAIIRPKSETEKKSQVW